MPREQFEDDNDNESICSDISDTILGNSPPELNQKDDDESTCSDISDTILGDNEDNLSISSISSDGVLQKQPKQPGRKLYDMSLQELVLKIDDPVANELYRRLIQANDVITENYDKYFIGPKAIGFFRTIEKIPKPDFKSGKYYYFKVQRDDFAEIVSDLKITVIEGVKRATYNVQKNRSKVSKKK